MNTYFENGNYDKFMEYYNKYHKSNPELYWLLCKDSLHDILMNNLNKCKYDNKFTSSNFYGTIIVASLYGLLLSSFTDNKYYTILPATLVTVTYLGSLYYVDYKMAKLVEVQKKILGIINA
jgi:hypothetical protein